MMIPIYGPYAAALSYIISVGRKPEQTKFYRGIRLTVTEIDEYIIGQKVVLRGFQSASKNMLQALNYIKKSN